jgi:diguanylate cyclase (GGDEF)-like protein
MQPALRHLSLLSHPYRYAVVAMVAVALVVQWIMVALWLAEDPERLRGVVIGVSIAISLVLLAMAVGMFVLLGRVHESEKELARLATTDSLTGVLNRRAFGSLAAQEFTRTRRYDRPLSVLGIDIDHFKRVNDTYGHAAGDDVLQAFTVAWQTVLRTTDTIGRIGGEEFAVLLPETAGAQARELAERVRQACERLPFRFLRPGERITISVGVGCVETGDSSIDHALARADEALHEAKLAGRNRVRASSDDVK